MEITCKRCHQTIQAENCFCPTCGLPQLVYAPDSANSQAPADRWTEAVRDASMVDWKPAMRSALLLAVPAGLLSSGLSPVGFFGLFWMAAAAAWAVALYVRGQAPAWVTIGAGARIDGDPCRRLTTNIEGNCRHGSPSVREPASVSSPACWPHGL